MKAFIVSVHGFSEVYIPAATAGKARWIAVRALQEAGYTDSAQFRNVRVARKKNLDPWAQQVKSGYYSHDQLLDSLSKLNLLRAL